MSARDVACATLLLLAGIGQAMASQDSDVDLIPATPAPPARAAPSPARGASAIDRVYLENAVTNTWEAGDPAVPLPPPPDYSWQERLLLDVREVDPMGEHVELHFSDRLNFRDENDLRLPGHENLVNDLREAYVSGHLPDQTYVDAGRINLKSGIALGYNPTDFFKTRTVTEPLSLDPGVLREDRLGTLMVRLQRIWSAASVTVALAPAIRRRTPIYTNVDLPSFNPALDRTNAQDRVLLKASINLGDDASPEFLLYREGKETHAGANLSVGLGQSAVAYLEWSGAERPNLITEAFDYGRETRSLPANAGIALAARSHRTFKNELAVGASYTTQLDITVNLEYLLNQAGLSHAQWDEWFAQGTRAPARSPLLEELWYIRSYARDQQQQSTEQAYFARADWVDAFHIPLELTGFTLIDAYDHSGIAQLSANYYLSDAWTIGAVGIRYFGSPRSDFGSLGASSSLLADVVHYF